MAAKYLKDYTPTNYLVESIDLTFEFVDDDNVTVTSVTQYYKNPKNVNFDRTINLDGNSNLDKVILNDKELTTADYQKIDSHLVVNNLDDKFTLTIVTKLTPRQNKSCMGLFTSHNIFLTQCEPEGFREITYYLDRPDVLAKFNTTIVAKDNQYKAMLSNGNKVLDEVNQDGKRIVKWVDPFKKPAYLFALVVGNLDVLKDTFTTKSGRNIHLEIYSEAENIERCHHAMASLKRAMSWDESRFNLEYDLDTYMIVATNDFNMGAMENKGLNVFNAKYVLADPKTTTDLEFIIIEAVIGHEYFHNYTGNRVTCRDWFQLSLKEGLTVFRDHEFTADLHNRSVQRIRNVNVLKQSQFVEDSGPLAHSVRPESYVEINNFYTTTIYEKGSEVVRMYQSILGQNGFKRGLSLYLERHDGMAATCEDFFNSMVEANPEVNLDGFMLWYSQAGTPQITVKEFYDSAKCEYVLEFIQTIPDTSNQTNKKPMLIPVNTGLFDTNGKELTNIIVKEGRFVDRGHGLVLLLDDTHNKFVFSNITNKPIPSLLREFSAPIHLKMDMPYAHQLFLVKHDSDIFNRLSYLKEVFINKIKDIYQQINMTKQVPSIDDKELFEVLRNLLMDETLDPDTKSLAFQVPNFNEMLANIDSVEPDSLYTAINHLQQQIGQELFDVFMETYELNLKREYNFTDHGSRALKNTSLSYILKSMLDKLDTDDNEKSLQFIETMALGQYHNSDNMTDSLASLYAINDLDVNVRNIMLDEFYKSWHSNELVIDKWFMLQATSSLVTIEKLNKLMVDKAFIATNPNKIYSLIRAFTNNGVRFHSDAGYDFIANQIINIDKFNPHVAGIVARGFNSCVYMAEKYRKLAKNAMQKILSQQNVSSGVTEIIAQIINTVK